MSTITDTTLDAALAAARGADAARLATMLRSKEAEVCWAALLELSWRPDEEDEAIEDALGAVGARLPAEAYGTLLEVVSARSARLEALPAWRRWGLDPRQEAGWRALEFARDPSRADALAQEAEDASTFLAYMMNRSNTLLTAHPELPTALAASPHASYVTTGLALIEPGMDAGAITLEAALDTLRAALEHDHLGVVCDALEHLSKPWAAWAWREEAHATLLGFARHTDRLIAQRAIRALTARGAHDPLALLARDESLDVTERGLALVGLAKCPDASADDVDAVLSIALEVPEGFGRQAIDALSTLHARAIFVGEEQIEDVLTLYDVCEVPAGQVAALLYTCRDAARDALLALPFDDTRWRRRAEVLARLEGGAPSLLDVARGGGVAAADALALAGRRRVDGTEALALELLARHPERALEALRHVGGQTTCDALAHAVGLATPEGHVVTHLRGVHEQAVELVWHLDAQRTWRDALLARLNPARLPDAIRRDLGGGISAAELELLILMKAEPEDELERLCAHGDAQAHDAIVELLRRVINSTSRRRLEPVHEHGRGAPRLAETALSEGLLSALRKWGERMHERGVIRPAVLASCGSREEAGRRVANHLLFATLGPDAHLFAQPLKVTLDALDGSLEPHQIRSLVKHLRHDDPDVRKVALRALAECHEDPGTLVRFVTMLRADDIETTRAALEALDASPHDAFVPLELISRVIERPNMNLKRLAAGQLARRCDTEACPLEVVDRALFWLGHHDHAEFRVSLFDALEGGLDDGTRPVVRHSIEAAREAGQERRVALLGALLERKAKDPKRWTPPRPEASPLADPFEDRTPAEALEYIATHTCTARESVKARLMSRIRALETIPLLSKPWRLKALRACGATITIADVLTCLRDADRAEDPPKMIRALLDAFIGDLKSWSRFSEDTREELAAGLYAVGDAERRKQLVGLWRAHGLRGLVRPSYGAAPPSVPVVETLWRDLADEERPARRTEAIEAASKLPWAPALHAEALRTHVIEGVRAPSTALSVLSWKVLDEDLAHLLDDVSSIKETTRMLDATGHSARMLRWVVDVWTNAHPTLSRRALSVIARHPAERRFALLTGRILAGEHGLAAGLGAPLLDGPEVARVRGVLRGDASRHLDAITVSGALGGHDARAIRREELARLKEHALDVSAPKHQRTDALDQLGSDDVFEVLGALRVLARHRDAEVEAAVVALGDHPEARVRDAARRTLRRVGSRASYLEATFAQLDDPRPDTRRSAIRALAHAGYAPALGAIVDAVFDHHAGLRRGAREALVLFGEEGEQALIGRARRARPDMRRKLVALRDELFTN